MSIYDKPVSALQTSDLQELLDDGAVENIRLEFKRDDPAKDESLKKLSSFANTFGGYLVIGAEGDNQGRLVGLPGLNPVAGFNQRIVQWCYDGIWPPITPFVSDPIPVPGDGGLVCYAIFVEESLETPHFLNNRRGAYIRTDEFSQRFQPQLATHEEISYLANRRRLAEERRSLLSRRSRERFQYYIGQFYHEHTHTTGDIGATLHFEICPRFPTRRLIDQRALLGLLREARIPWRQTGFPLVDRIISQHESGLVFRAEAGFSLLEANVWGYIHYAAEIEELYQEQKGIHLPWFVGHLLARLEHARRLLDSLGYDGSLWISTLLARVRNVPFWVFPGGSQRNTGRSSPLDDTVEFAKTYSMRDLREKRDTVARDVLQMIFYSLNWADVATDEAELLRIIADGYGYNYWGAPPTGSGA